MNTEDYDDFADLTDQELRNMAADLNDEIHEISEQIAMEHDIGLRDASATRRDWLHRAMRARRYKRAQVRRLHATLRQRKLDTGGTKEDRRAAHVGTLINAKFIKIARQVLAPPLYQALLDKARAEAGRVLDENAAPVVAEAEA